MRVDFIANFSFFFVRSHNISLEINLSRTGGGLPQTLLADLYTIVDGDMHYGYSRR